MRLAGNLTQQQQSQHAAVQMALMRAIPCMAMHQTALPFVQRALMHFSQPGEQQLLLSNLNVTAPACEARQIVHKQCPCPSASDLT